jgi:biopolymer transport protein ExbD
MSEIHTSTSRNSIGKSKKLSTRIDLTPMVDLGFLLITFFIFTSALSQPVAMKLHMPNDRVVKDSTKVSDERTLTLLVSGNDQLFYYRGFFDGRVFETTFTAFREIILDKKQQLFKKYKSRNIVVLIKVANEANYKNIVNSLDEMVICLTSMLVK